ncbi:MAG: hypothetical protein OXC11_16325 [Rhodospirillales bacterium]|nr:hypothetical protein [Rhodospirillales bacterium]
MTRPDTADSPRLVYAGIGSRRTPPEILAVMTRIAQWLHRTGWHLNSGGADGADRAFADGATAQSRTLFMPWPGYNGHSGPDCRTLAAGERQPALDLAARLHPAWRKCSRGARALHARNVGIILGPGLNRPVDALICWTPGGEITGGTGMGLRIAAEAGIPVLNLAVDSPRDACLFLRAVRVAEVSGYSVGRVRLD